MKIKKCHSNNVHLKASGMTVKIKFSPDEMYAVMGMANELAEGCVCVLVKEIFMDTFKDMAKAAVDAQTMNEASPPPV